MGIGTVSDRIPEPSVTRLATYLHVLRALGQRGVLVASSGQLATAAGVNPAILRKDLSHVGANGVRGVGYDVGRLTARIALALHTDTVHTVALVGAGTLGRLLVTHTATDRTFRVVAMFDDDPDVIGTVVDDVVVAPCAALATLSSDPAIAQVDIGVIATGADKAQRAADALVAAGVRQLLNVTAATLSTDSDVVVRQVDLALELQVLTFHASRTPLSVAEGGQQGHVDLPGAGLPGDDLPDVDVQR
ncbi:redox-sensing transcriptional repressor Rex [Gordonia aichiensis]|uniref:Redox-sensing transcriptional repressor Rex n=1 Tax=Gordonia aichiensis NBRC 108223 TaxID=1220583 RepID=L7KEU4_9ACTN|nr:redox-sensing transcriptional repressor Rex [Gordonia aichiensis]GAC46981.1 redox-sensing transcriptional repressor Rex [Gordonia aichiensis NBRC 108223]